MNIFLKKTEDLSRLTQKVMDCFNTMSDQEFLNKFQASKKVYLKRVIKYGDPYMNAPLAKIGKKLNAFIKMISGL